MTEKTRCIPDFKEMRRDMLVEEVKDPKYIYIPITDLRCPKGDTCVAPGDEIKMGQLIGTRHGGFFDQPIYSTVSGKVVGIEQKLHGLGSKVECIKIENDFKYELHENVKPRTEKEIKKLTKKDLVEIMEKAGLVGLGGGAFPMFIKYKTDKPVEYVLANGVECEPYIISDYQLMKSHAREITEGLVYAMRSVDAKKGIVVFKEKYPELAVKFNEAFKDFPDYDLEVKMIKCFYPQGWELQTIKSALGIKVPVGDLTVDHGIIVSNTSTLYGLYNAVTQRLPMMLRYFSVAGNGIKEEKNFYVRIGTPVKDLVEMCGGYRDEENKVLIIGGPMMGTNLTSDDFIVSQTTTSLVVLNEEKFVEEPCVNCASCVYSCPVNIQPVQIMRAYKQKDKDVINSLEVNKCIECGLCSYVCPSKIHLTEYMRLAKALVK